MHEHAKYTRHATRLLLTSIRTIICRSITSSAGPQPQRTPHPRPAHTAQSTCRVCLSRARARTPWRRTRHATTAPAPGARAAFLCAPPLGGAR
eukprot:5042428-Prymnesium_polylepis.1